MKESFANNKNIAYVEKNSVEFVQFRNLKKYENIITHGFTTRHGGVSTDECRSLNMGFNRNDSRENVLENYRRISEALGIDFKNMVFSNQVHEKRIRIVDENDRGKGIVRTSDIIGYDGLITNKREVAIVTFYADCVPIFFFDPQKKVIALSHSGWRGTVKEIAGETVRMMKENFGCMSENIETAIGPSIGFCCFEVGEEVYNEFVDNLSWSKEYCEKTAQDKWHIKLQEIIRKTLVNYGIKEHNICMANICTKCNSDVFFSHRGDKGKTGSLVAIMQLL